MTKPRNRINITTADDLLMNLLTRAEKATELTPPQIVLKFMGAHVHELQAFVEWFEKLPADDTKLKARGKFLIHGYGPDNLITSIKEIDPAYKGAAK